MALAHSELYRDPLSCVYRIPVAAFGNTHVFHFLNDLSSLPSPPPPGFTYRFAHASPMW